MERMVIIVCGFVAWLLGVAWGIHGLISDIRLDFWSGVLAAVLGGLLATFARKLPQGAAQGAVAESKVIQDPPT